MVPTGTWPYYNFIFLTAMFNLIYDLSYYFKIIDKDIGAKNSLLDLVVSTFLTIGTGILILNLSDKLYL